MNCLALNIWHITNCSNNNINNLLSFQAPEEWLKEMHPANKPVSFCIYIIIYIYIYILIRSLLIRAGSNNTKSNYL